MPVHRHAAAVVADGDGKVAVQLDLDAVGMARHRLAHGVVEHLGHQVMQRPLVGAADIHARPLADRLETFENLDIGGAIGLRRVVVAEEIGGMHHAAALFFLFPRGW